MFLILPYKTDLRLGQWPVVTYILIILCLIIHYIQDDNRKVINVAATKYCNTVYQSDAAPNTLDYIVKNKEECISDITGLHGIDNPDRLRILFEIYNKKYKEYSEEDLITVIDIFTKHMVAFGKTAPRNLDSLFSYDPSSWNPFSMIMAGLSHADWSHVIFNLIFFYAFTPALELLTRSPWRFSLSLVLIQVVSNYAYSISSLFAEYPVPTLGFSGVVMGMIGLSAYLMPWARIKTIFWFLYYFRILAIPAWFLALWYIGWDTYDLMTTDEHGSINVLVHVFGGFTGYFLGHLFFKSQREINDAELIDEMDFMRAKRQDFFSLASSYKGNNANWERKHRAEEIKRDEGRRRDILYKYISVGQDSKAINLILNDYHLKAPSIEIYEELFSTIKDWNQGRAFYCLGRLIINHHIKNDHSSAAIRFAKICYELDPDFVLANPAHVLLLAKKCIEYNDEKLAYLIIKDSSQRYHNTVNDKLCLDMEVLLSET